MKRHKTARTLRFHEFYDQTLKLKNQPTIMVTAALDAEKLAIEASIAEIEADIAAIEADAVEMSWDVSTEDSLLSPDVTESHERQTLTGIRLIK